ncbi:uncharacterized [Tachysurus ichikawai]
MASKDQRQPRRAEAVLYGGVSPLQLEETWPSIRLGASSDFLASRATKGGWCELHPFSKPRPLSDICHRTACDALPRPFSPVLPGASINWEQASLTNTICRVQPSPASNV